MAASKSPRGHALFVTDPLDSLLADIDATVGLMNAAQSEGAEVWVCGPEDLAAIEGRLQARVRRVVLHERTRAHSHRWRIASPWYAAGAPGLVDVAGTFEVAMLRIDPPVDARYLHATYLLDLAAAAGVRVVNHPAGVRALHEKLLTLRCPTSRPRPSSARARTWSRTSSGVTAASCSSPSTGSPAPTCGSWTAVPGAGRWWSRPPQAGRRHVIAQEYLPAVAAGNKRLFLLDGEIVGAVLRRPPPTTSGSAPPVAPPTWTGRRAHRRRARPAARRARHRLAGLDVIDGRLIEVNVTCPGGMHKTDALLGTDLSGDMVRRLLDHSLKELAS